MWICSSQPWDLCPAAAEVPPVSPKLVTQLSHAAVPSRMRAQGHTPGAPRIPREIKEVTGAELTKLCVDTLKADTAAQV